MTFTLHLVHATTHKGVIFAVLRRTMASFPDFQDSYYWQTVNDRLLKDTYDSDQAMYPAPELTYDRLKSWIDACPELCICLQRDQTESDSNQLKKSGNDDTHGIIITLPLFRSYWERLINEEIEEHHVDASEMFPPRSNTQSQAHGEIQQAQVGLHVFHIERYPGFSPTRHGTTFTAMALDEVRRRIRLGFLSWEVVGYSGELDDDNTFKVDFQFKSQ